VNRLDRRPSNRATDNTTILPRPPWHTDRVVTISLSIGDFDPIDRRADTPCTAHDDARGAVRLERGAP
jgi:hypothetical protein